MYEIFPSGNFTYAAPLSGYAAYRIPVWYSAISPPLAAPKRGFLYIVVVQKESVELISFIYKEVLTKP
ncbi:hypothetical protein [Alistipes senegalensis]|jgi:hypothetical protein|uniref:hypothetical protein n=1 Tax=Alistipes senegalensis TaxID=1288121 RepID=UPI0034A4E3DC